MDNKILIEKEEEKCFLYISSRDSPHSPLEKILEPDYIKFNKSRPKGYTEIAPLKNFQSAWSSNAKDIMKKSGYLVDKIEKSILVEDNKFNKEDYDDLLYVFNPSDNYYDNNKAILIKPPEKILDIAEYNNIHSLGFDEQDIAHYSSIFKDSLTEVELFDLSQSNSEHSRHWFFKGKYIVNENLDDISLFDRIRSTLTTSQSENSILSFCDNASAIKGYEVDYLKLEPQSQYTSTTELIDISYTAETHNFPTGISPFPGAATGVGGRIRDTIAIGCGGLPVVGIAGYSVGDLSTVPPPNTRILPPSQILIQASNGASDYGNKFGEPIICGYTRSFRSSVLNGDKIEYLKPIMFSGGMGIVKRKNIYKNSPRENQLIVRLGGPAYRIGIGGGSASSRSQASNNHDLDRIAVQRGDPEMENRLVKLLKQLLDRQTNIISSIHDQGAGGLGNVVKEIVSPLGGEIDLDKITLGDKTLTSRELWSSEFQESVVILIDREHQVILNNLCKIENVYCDVLGCVTNTNRIVVYDSRIEKNYVVLNFDLNDVLENLPRKEYKLYATSQKLSPQSIDDTHDLEYYISNVLKNVTVGSKRFLTNKVDRSVSGLVAQQQCVGPLQTPLSNFGLMSLSYIDTKGAVVAVGEQPIKGLVSPVQMARLTVMEMLTNIIWVKISSIHDIKCSGNWMWSLETPGESYKLHRAANELSKFLKKLDIAIDGGKDSLSMKVSTPDGDVHAPGTLVLSGYCTVPDITKYVTPCLKPTKKSYIIWIDFGMKRKKNLGATTFSYCNHSINPIGNSCSYVSDDQCIYIKTVFNLIQEWIQHDVILAGHDISDGGLITSLIEMSISGNVGVNVNLNEDLLVENSPLHTLFHEDPGLLIQVNEDYYKYTMNILKDKSIRYEVIADTTLDTKFTINMKLCHISTYKSYYSAPIENLRRDYEYSSNKLELQQCNPDNAMEEYNYLSSPESTQVNIYNLPFRAPNLMPMDLRRCPSIDSDLCIPPPVYVGIIREEGSNGEKEMAAAFELAGFRVLDLPINYLINTTTNEIENLIRHVHCIAFVGGFTYSDVFGAGTGWSRVIKHNTNVEYFFDKFYKQSRNISIGICNGCQLMVKLNIIPNVKIVQNKSKRFESRFSYLKIQNIHSKSPWLNKLDDAILGTWVAHGEGRFMFENNNDNYICMKYVDQKGNSTQKYPFNPNGSEYGCAAITNETGNHLAMMPHPERTFLTWQHPDFPYYNCSTSSFNNLLPYNNYQSPWFRLFKNAYHHCIQ